MLASHRAIVFTWVCIAFSASNSPASPSSDWPDVSGRFGPSARDVQHILAVVRPRSDIRKPITKIEMDRTPEEATVYGGNGYPQSVVTLVKKRGAWSVASVQQITEVIHLEAD
jgi:hypothetical protein